MSKLDSEAIEIAGQDGATLEITPTDGLVHVGLGDNGIWLDAPSVDQLVHGLLEAQAMA